MELFYSPLSCSLAAKIAFAEVGVSPELHRVRNGENGAKTTDTGEDYRTINPRGQVPAIRIDGGEMLTENVAVLSYIADLKPEAGLGGVGSRRYQVLRWLGFVNSEYHTPCFGVLLNPAAPDGAKAFAMERLKVVMAHLEERLADREWLADEYSVADIYLAVALNWTQAVQIDLGGYPNLKALRDRVFARPAAAPLVAGDLEMYQAA